MDRSITLPRQVRGAEVRASSYDEAQHSVEVIWTTGATVRRRTWRDGDFDEELIVSPEAVRLDRLNAGAPLLNTHSDWSLSDVIGSVVPGSARIENGQGVATVRLSAAPGDADAVLKIRDGIVRNISVGYAIHRVQKIEAADGTVPLWRVVDWEPLEISAVPIPADPGAQVRAAEGRGAPELFTCVLTGTDARSSIHAATAALEGENTMKNGAVAAAETSGNEVNDTRAAAPPAPAPVDVEAARKEAVRADRERAREIREIGEKLKLDRSFIDQHAGGETTVEAFRAFAIDEKAKADQNKGGERGSRIEVTGEDESEKRGAAMQTALLHRFDPNGYAKEFDACPQAREFRGMSLIELGREALEARGVRTRGMSKLEIADMALSLRSRASDFVRSGGMMSTSDFPNVLANVATKTLRDAYKAAPQTFRPLVRVTTVPDFKAVSRVQLGEAPQLEKVNEHGEFKRGKMGESAESYSVSTYGKVVAITRQVLVNDDLNAFTRIPRAFGMQAANLESDLVWAQITSNPTMGDNVALFHATHANLGTAGAISVTTVGAGRLAMSTQKGLDGASTVGVEPVYIVVPKSLQTVAEQFRGQLFPAASANVVPDSMRQLAIIAESRLDAASATNWYMAGDPAQIDMIELAYLEGQEGLFTESRMGFDVDGMEVKVRLDVAAKVIDYRGFWKNPN